MRGRFVDDWGVLIVDEKSRRHTHQPYFELSDPRSRLVAGCRKLLDIETARASSRCTDGISWWDRLCLAEMAGRTLRMRCLRGLWGRDRAGSYIEVFASLGILCYPWVYLVILCLSCVSKQSRWEHLQTSPGWVHGWARARAAARGSLKQQEMLGELACNSV